MSTELAPATGVPRVEPSFEAARARGGPAFLCAPTLTEAVLRLVMATGFGGRGSTVSLAAMPARRRQLRAAICHLGTLRPPPDPVESLESALNGALGALLGAFVPRDDESQSVAALLRRLWATLDGSPSEPCDWPMLASALEAASANVDERLRAVIRPLLVPALRAAEATRAQARASVARACALGVGWCCVGLARLALLAPAQPVDPAVRPAVKRAVLLEEAAASDAWATALRRARACHMPLPARLFGC